MKAKEYAEMFFRKVEDDASDENINNVLIDILKQFMNECSVLSETRNSRSDECLVGIFKEQSNKWRAFARRVNSRLAQPLVKEDAFKEFIFSKMPELRGDF